MMAGAARSQCILITYPFAWGTLRAAPRTTREIVRHLGKLGADVLASRCPRPHTRAVRDPGSTTRPSASRTTRSCGRTPGRWCGSRLIPSTHGWTACRCGRKSGT